MVTERVERRLTAILAADVAGYSRLMGADEEGTLAQLKAHRRTLVDPNITEHRGRIVKTTGDGMLVEFASVVDALRCAVEVQQGMAKRNAQVPQDKRIDFRVGINVGDIIIEPHDIYGDGVNIAARLEGIAEPGGICVSARVQEDAQGKLEIAFEDAGEQQLKNIARAVRVYRVRLSGAAQGQRPALPLPDKPSIAALPFQNMSGDPEQEYFADGVVEEIITALSRFRNLFVIARNSSFTYKGRAVDVKQVGRELGVRYVLEGSVRKTASRVRITGQLIDASTGAHLWADRFDGELEDIFDVQDNVTMNVVGAIAPKLEQAEIERAKRKPTAVLDAYDLYLRALSQVHKMTPETLAEAISLSKIALQLDPQYAAAAGLVAWCRGIQRGQGWVRPAGPEDEDGIRLARLRSSWGPMIPMRSGWGLICCPLWGIKRPRSPRWIVLLRSIRIRHTLGGPKPFASPFVALLMRRLQSKLAIAQSGSVRSIHCATCTNSRSRWHISVPANTVMRRSGSTTRCASNRDFMLHFASKSLFAGLSAGMRRPETGWGGSSIFSPA